MDNKSTKDSRKDSNFEGLTPPLGKVQHEIPCKKCKGFSGYTNDDLIQISGREKRNLPCKACGKVTIKIVPTGNLIDE